MRSIFGIVKKISGHALLRGSTIVFIGTMASNVAAYLYHLVVGRILGPAGYGELSSLISLLYIFGVPTSVLQTVLVKNFSITKAHNEASQAKYIYMKITKWLSLVLGIFFFIVLLFLPAVSNFLHLSSGRLLIWVFLFFMFSTLAGVSASLTQGFQFFIWVGMLPAIGAFFRLFLSIPFAYRGVEWAMIASVLSTVIMYGLYFLPIRSILQKKEKKFPFSKNKFLSYAIPTFLALLGITSMYSFDIVLVRHFLSPYDAGIYSAVAVLGKVIYYASSAVIMVLFPVLSERHEKKESTGDLIRFSILLVGGISFGVTACFALFPNFVTHMLFGPAFNAVSSYLGLFGLFISLFSIASIFIYICLALEKKKIWTYTIIAALLQIILIWFIHDSIASIIYINVGVMVFLLISVVLYYIYGND